MVLKEGYEYRKPLPPMSRYANSCIFQVADVTEIAILPCDDRPKTALSSRRKQHIFHHYQLSGVTT